MRRRREGATSLYLGGKYNREIKKSPELYLYRLRYREYDIPQTEVVGARPMQPYSINNKILYSINNEIIISSCISKGKALELDPIEYNLRLFQSRSCYLVCVSPLLFLRYVLWSYIIDIQCQCNNIKLNVNRIYLHVTDFIHIQAS